MNRYENGKIYMITDIAMTKKFIGSTTASLKKGLKDTEANIQSIYEKVLTTHGRIGYLMNFGVANGKYC